MKVKIEQLNESKTDVKPHIKAESNPDGNIKIEKQDPDETVDQKPIIKTEANEAIIDGVQVKTDPACDVKPAIKNEATTENVLEENQEANDEPCLQGEVERWTVFKGGFKGLLGVPVYLHQYPGVQVWCGRSVCVILIVGLMFIGQTTGANNDVCMQGVEDGDLADDVADFQAPKKRFRTPGGQVEHSCTR